MTASAWGQERDITNCTKRVYQLKEKGWCSYRKSENRK